MKKKLNNFTLDIEYYCIYVQWAIIDVYSLKTKTNDTVLYYFQTQEKHDIIFTSCNHIQFSSQDLECSRLFSTTDWSTCSASHFPLIFHNTAQTCFNPVHQWLSAIPPDPSSSELANVPSDDNEQRRLNLNSEVKGLPGGEDKHAGHVVLCPAEIKNCLLFV